ncbi:MAG: hypothetical protein RJB09_1050, partial [Pseudomonadota bacterium]
MKSIRITLVACTVATLQALATAATAQDFYTGKQINML